MRSFQSEYSGPHDFPMVNYINTIGEGNPMSRAFPLILLLAFLSALPFASASVTVQLSQDYYNIGDTIAAAASCR